MLTIKRILETGTCVFCNADKESASVVMDGHGQGELQLCWSCLKKMARMKMRIEGQEKPKPEPVKPVVAVPVTAANGPAK